MENKVASRLASLGMRIADLIGKKKVPRVEVPQRGLNNVIFDKKCNLLRMGDKTSMRNFMNKTRLFPHKS